MTEERETYGDYSVDDEDQPGAEDDGTPSDVADELDRGYSPPEKYSAGQGYGNTPWEEEHRESIDQRIGQEEPEVWEVRQIPLGDREQFRAGRLVEDDGAVAAGGTDGFAIDAGISGGAASAEEAAVHLIAEEYVDEGRYHDDDDEI